MSWVSIGKIAELYGVTCQTIRNWAEEGMFKMKRTRGGHRRFYWEEIAGEEDEEKETVIYSRVSSHDQSSDLKRQTRKLKKFCDEQQLENVEVIEEIGSGMNYRKKGLRKLIAKVIQGKVRRIVVNFKDRLMRFGFEIFNQLCEWRGVEIVEVGETPSKSFEEQLVEDVIMIMTVYCSKIYGKRSHKNRESKLIVQS